MYWVLFNSNAAPTVNSVNELKEKKICAITRLDKRREERKEGWKIGRKDGRKTGGTPRLT